jgi:hypothetical protein
LCLVHSPNWAHRIDHLQRGARVVLARTRVEEPGARPDDVFVRSLPKVDKAVTRTYAGVRYLPYASNGHVESYFLKANDPNGTRALWLKATIHASDRDPSHAVAEAWAIAFDKVEGHVAAKAGVPYESARFSTDELDVEIDGSTFTGRRWKGRVATGERSIAYDLVISGGGEPLVHLPFAWMYEPSPPSSKIVALVPDARADGEVTVNGKKWILSRWPMTIGHNWGRSHAPRYAWGHCNAWDGGEALMFEGFTARIVIGPVLAPPSTMLFVQEGGRRLARRGYFGLGPLDEQTTLRRWSFRSTRGKPKVRGELWAETDDFVGLYYPNPDGTMVYCLNTKLARAELVVEIPGRGERLFRSRCAALEIATTDPNHGVKMYL